MSDTVIVNGVRFAPVDEERAADVAERLREFKTEATTFWGEFFLDRDVNSITGERIGMYCDGDEEAPFFSEAFLYNLLGKDEARSVLGIMRELCDLAGVKWR